jgi:hypothetical protein
MNEQQHGKPKWVTMGEAATLTKISRPKLERLAKEYNIELRVNVRDKRQKFLDLNILKRILGE